MSGDLSFPAQLLTVGKYLPVGGTQVGDLHLGNRGAGENRLVPEPPLCLNLSAPHTTPPPSNDFQSVRLGLLDFFMMLFQVLLPLQWKR